MRFTVDRKTAVAFRDGAANRVVKDWKAGQTAARKGDNALLFRQGDRRTFLRLIVDSMEVASLGEVVSDIRSARDHGSPTSMEFKRRYLTRLNADHADLTDDQ